MEKEEREICIVIQVGWMELVSLFYINAYASQEILIINEQKKNGNNGETRESSPEWNGSIIRINN